MRKLLFGLALTCLYLVGASPIMAGRLVSTDENTKKEEHMKNSISAVSAIMVLTAAVLMILLAAFPVFAQITGPCAADFAKYCGEVVPGAGRLARCYEQQKSNLSPACVAWAESVKANNTAVNTACANEIANRCDFVKSDPLETINCLQSNYIDLSSNCRNTLNQFKYFYPVPAQ